VADRVHGDWDLGTGHLSQPLQLLVERAGAIVVWKPGNCLPERRGWLSFLNLFDDWLGTTLPSAPPFTKIVEAETDKKS